MQEQVTLSSSGKERWVPGKREREDTLSNTPLYIFNFVPCIISLRNENKQNKNLQGRVWQ